MRFTLSSDQELLGKAVRDLLERACDSAALRAAWRSPDGRVPGLWGRLAEVGVTALTIPEEYGGLGLGEVDLVGVLEETGRVALPEPVVETAVAAGLLADAGGEPAARWLPRLAEGSAVAAVGLAGSAYVPWSEQADLLVLQRGGELHALERSAVRLTPQPSADAGRPVAAVAWEPGPGTLLLAGPRVDRVAATAGDRGALGVATQLVGLAQGVLDQAVRHAGQREQFGRPIGGFQAVKHQLADVYVGIAFARPLVQRAAWSLARGLPSRARDVSMAKHAAATAAARAARVGLQVHGAIGYTFEHDLHMWLKRIWSLTPAWGDPAWHRARVAAAVAQGGQPRVP